MAEVASAYVSILPSAKGFGTKLNSQVGGELDSSGKAAGKKFGTALKVGALAALGGLAVVGSFLKDSVSAASDAQQAIGGVEAVFGKYAKGVVRDSKKAAQGLGLSASAYNELITVSGAMLKNKGIEDFADQSTNLIGIGADLSAMFGGTTKEAVDALNAAMRGESDPIERYGISLGEASVKAELFANNQGALTGAALEQAKTQARLAIITRQSADAQGAFGRESDTLAGKQARLSAQFDNFKSTIGTALLPVVTKLFGFLNDTALPAITSFKDRLAEGSPIIKSVGDFVKNTLLPPIQDLAGWVMNSLVPAIQDFAKDALPGVKSALASVQKGLKSAQPFFKFLGDVVTSVLLPVLGKLARTILPLVGDQIELLGKAFGALGRIGTALWNKALQPAFKFILGGVASILDLWSSMLSTLAKVPGFGWAKKAAEAMGNAADKARDVADGIKKIPPNKTVKITVVYAYQGKRNAGKESQLDSLGRQGAGGLPPRKSFLAFIDKTYGDAGTRLFGVIEKGIKAATPKTVKAAQDAFSRISDRLTETRDNLKGTLDGLKDDFASLAESVSSAFAGNLFEATTASDFIANLTAKKGELSGLLASFKTLQGWGLPGAFLSQLFASGNGALITELAGMGQTGATSAANLFGDVQSLGNQLGNAVASNDPVATRIDETNKQLTEVNRQLSFLADDIGGQLNGAAAKAHRDKKNRGSK